MNLDRMIKLDERRLPRQARRCRPSSRPASRTAWSPSSIAGEEAPDYGTPVFRHGRGVGKLTSPSAGRSPTVDKRDRDGLHRGRADRARHAASRWRCPTAGGARGRRQLPDLRPGEDAPAVVSATRRTARSAILATGAGRPRRVARRACARCCRTRTSCSLSDHAYAPYARRAGAGGRRPGVALAAELAGGRHQAAGRGVAAGHGGRARGRSRRRPACPRWRSTRRWCTPRPGGRQRTDRGDLGRRHTAGAAVDEGARVPARRGEVVPLPWPGWRRRSRPGATPDPATRARGAGRLHRRAHLTLRVDEAAAQFDEPVDCAALTADRVHRQLMRMGALARRRRPGRLMLRSSHPVRAQASLPGAGAALELVDRAADRRHRAVDSRPPRSPAAA